MWNGQVEREWWLIDQNNINQRERDKEEEEEEEEEKYK